MAQYKRVKAKDEVKELAKLILENTENERCRVNERDERQFNRYIRRAMQHANFIGSAISGFSKSEELYAKQVA